LPQGRPVIADPGSTPEHFLREVSALVLGTGAGI
jgi:hypothetical protein